MADALADLTGLRVLVVEDVLLVAEMISDGLGDSGCEVVGPVSRVERGLELAREAPLDGAVLDLNLAGRSGLPIAKALEARGIPFVFVTGYDPQTMLPAEYKLIPCVTKPFTLSRLLRMVAQHFSSGNPD